MDASDGRQYFNELAENWNQNPHRAERLQRLPVIFRQHFNMLKGTVLDAGCGAGVLLPLLHNNESIEGIIAIDNAFNMVRKTKELNGGRDKAVFLNASACVLPCTASLVDHVIAFALFPHLENPGKALSEFYRVLRPGGYLHILHLMSSEELNAMHKQHHPQLNDHILPSIEKLSQQAQAAGFQIAFSIERDDLYLLRVRKSK